MPVRNGEQSVPIARQPGIIHADDRFGFRRDLALYGCRIDQQCAGIHIGKHGDGAHVNDAVGAGSEGHGRDNHLIVRPDSGSEHRRVQGRRSIGHRHGMAHSGKSGECGLELRHLGPGGQPVGLEHLNHGGDVVRIYRLFSIRNHMSCRRMHIAHKILSTIPVPCVPFVAINPGSLCHRMHRILKFISLIHFCALCAFCGHKSGLSLPQNAQNSQNYFSDSFLRPVCLLWP